MPVAYFEFDGAIPKLSEKNLIAADASSPLLLVDVDPSSPNVGQFIPTVANTPFER